MPAAFAAPRAEQAEERTWLWPVVSAGRWGKQAAPGRALGTAASELPSPANSVAMVDAARQG